MSEKGTDVEEIREKQGIHAIMVEGCGRMSKIEEGRESDKETPGNNHLNDQRTAEKSVRN